MSLDLDAASGGRAVSTNSATPFDTWKQNR